MSLPGWVLIIRSIDYVVLEVIKGERERERKREREGVVKGIMLVVQQEFQCADGGARERWGLGLIYGMWRVIGQFVGRSGDGAMRKMGVKPSGLRRARTTPSLQHRAKLRTSTSDSYDSRL